MSNAAMQYGDVEVPTSSSVLMPTVPDELFRRKMVARFLKNAEEKLDTLEQALLLEFEAAAKAARYQLAAKLMGYIDRPDLQAEFERARDESIVRGKIAIKTRMRDYSGRASTKGIPRGQRTTVDRHTKPPDDQPRRSK